MRIEVPEFTVAREMQTPSFLTEVANYQETSMYRIMINDACYLQNDYRLLIVMTHNIHRMFID